MPQDTGLCHHRGIVVLYSAADESQAIVSRDVLADLETIATAEAVAQVLRQHTGLPVHLLPAARDVETKLHAYPPEDYVIFNLFEGLVDQVPDETTDSLDEEARTAFALEALGYRFTGADGRALDLALDKGRAKRVLQEGGVLTPAWRVFARGEGVSHSTLGSLAFPLIVKPLTEDSSLAIDDNAVVTDLEQLQARVRYVMDQYRQPVLVEEFIEGREFNVSVWGNPPEVLPLAEVDLTALGDPLKRIVSFAAKWEEGSFAYEHTPVTCPADVAPTLAERIRSTALRAWTLVCGHRGYGRVDMRTRGEEVYVLEVNPNPSLAADAGFARAAQAAGLDYAHMILKILSFALEERGVHHTSR